MRINVPKNCIMLDQDTGRFLALKFIEFKLFGNYFWHAEDIELENGIGVAITAYVDVESERPIDLGALWIVDISNDDSEPDLDLVTQINVSNVDDFLLEATRSELENNNMKLLEWQKTYLNEKNNNRALVTGYTYLEGGMLKQAFTARLKHLGKKISIISTFDSDKKELIAENIFKSMSSVILHSVEIVE